MTTLSRILRWPFRVLLGLYVVGQLAFLVVGNLSPVAQHFQEYYKKKPVVEAWAPEWPREEGTTYKYVGKSELVTRRYGELVCQPQNWSLFAPTVWGVVPFPAVEFRWQDGKPPPPGYRRSDNEPEDVNAFLKVGKFRLRRYEGGFALVGLYLTPEQSLDDVAVSWQTRIRKQVRDEWRAIRAYMQWRWEA